MEVSKPLASDVGKQYGSTEEDPTSQRGITSEQAEELLKKFGPNELQANAKDGFLKILFTQMINLIFLLTTIASVICYLTGDDVKASFLIGLVCTVCFINALGEYSGQDAGAALKQMAPQRAMVKRDSEYQPIDVREIVPGDVVRLGIGDMVPADMQVLESVDLQANEAVLTGESSEANKSVEERKSDTAFPSNMLYHSTGIVAGTGVGLVKATGMSTQVGLIAQRLNPEKERLNPLQRSINILGKIIGGVCGCVITVGFVLSYTTRYQNLPPSCLPDDDMCFFWDSFVRGLLMAIAIIPHGLPLVVMVMLRVGSGLMAERNAVVTRQSAVDYLGATRFICTDKTGTLTEGKMCAKILTGLIRAVPVIERNTFVDLQMGRPLSLDGFYHERNAISCPTSLVSEPGSYIPGVQLMKSAALDRQQEDMASTCSTTDTGDCPTGTPPLESAQARAVETNPRAVLLLEAALPRPALGSPQLPSVGSAGHERKECKPCAFLATKGCASGVQCAFCHLCDKGEKKKRQKEKRQYFGAMRRFQQIAGGSTRRD